jgi:hypothetical protein
MLLEHNVVVKDPLRVGLRFASCYPNLYRSAMSSLGFHIIYDFLNIRRMFTVNGWSTPMVRAWRLVLL